MSPPPVRVETNASFAPSGEYSGRDSSAGCDTSRCASPPFEGATQMSPPDTKAISGRVGHSAGSVRYGTPAAESANGIRKSGRLRIALLYRDCDTLSVHEVPFPPDGIGDGSNRPRGCPRARNECG